MINALNVVSMLNKRFKHIVSKIDINDIIPILYFLVMSFTIYSSRNIVTKSRIGIVANVYNLQNCNNVIDTDS